MLLVNTIGNAAQYEKKRTIKKIIRIKIIRNQSFIVYLKEKHMKLFKIK